MSVPLTSVQRKELAALLMEEAQQKRQDACAQSPGEFQDDLRGCAKGLEHAARLIQNS